MATQHDASPSTAPDQPTALADRIDAVLRGVDQLRDRPVASTLAALALAAVAGLVWWSGRPGPVVPVEARIPLATTGSPDVEPAMSGAADRSTSTAEPQELLVHVAGAVRDPGIVELQPGSRIGDAVDAAGGPTAAADVHQLNLAAPVVDGLQVRVPIDGEIVAPTGIAPPGGSASDGDGPLLVDINAASAAELEALPGIGPALAAAIVEWRRVNGPFSGVDELLDVPGIGPAKLDRLAAHVIV